MLIGVGFALGLIILGAFGLRSNPKPELASPKAGAVTHAVATKAGATVTPTVKQ